MELLNSLAVDDESTSDRRQRLELRVEILQGSGQQDEADRLRRALMIDSLLDAGTTSLQLR